MNLENVEGFSEFVSIMGTSDGASGFIYGFTVCMLSVICGYSYVFCFSSLYDFFFHSLRKILKFLWHKFKSRKEASK